MDDTPTTPRERLAQDPQAQEKPSAGRESALLVWQVGKVLGRTLGAAIGAVLGWYVLFLYVFFCYECAALGNSWLDPWADLCLQQWCWAIIGAVLGWKIGLLGMLTGICGGVFGVMFAIHVSGVLLKMGCDDDLNFLISSVLICMPLGFIIGAVIGNRISWAIATRYKPENDEEDADPI